MDMSDEDTKLIDMYGPEGEIPSQKKHDKTINKAEKKRLRKERGGPLQRLFGKKTRELDEEVPEVTDEVPSGFEKNVRETA